MAIFRVDSNVVGGAGDGTTWADAYTNLEACFAAAATVAGSTVYIDDGSAYAYSADALYVSKGTLVAPIDVYSVDKADDSYSTGAIEDADGGSWEVVTDGFVNVYGVTFKSGDRINVGATNDHETWQWTDCNLQQNGVSADAFFEGSRWGDGAFWRLINTNISFGGVGHRIMLSAGQKFEWLGGTLQTTDIDILVGGYFSQASWVSIRGVDLSIMNGGALFNGFGSSADEAGFFGEIVGCKLNATPPVLVLDTLPGVNGGELSMIGCGSAGIPQTHIHKGQGDIYHETSIVRTATYDGTNKYSMKMITNSNASYDQPLRFKLAEIWCAANPTLTVHCTHDVNGDSSDLQDDEFWIEVERPKSGNAAFREWDRDSKMAVLGTAGDLTTEGAAGWTNSQNVDNSIAEIIAGGAAGIHTIWACMAIASKTVYVCPKIDVS